MSFRFVRQFLVFVCCVFFIVSSAYGATLTVMPTWVQIEPPQVATTVVVRNEGRAPVKMQVRVFRWEQKNGKDIYFPTNDVIASPPFVTIKGGADGVVRVARIAKKPLAKLESYRLFLDELPSPRVRSRMGEQGVKIEMVVRQVLPVIFLPARKSAAGGLSLAFHAQAARGGFQITAVNSGRTPVPLGAVVLFAGGMEIGGTSQSVGTVLPNSEFKFLVKAKKGGQPQSIRITSGGKMMEYPIR